MSSEVDLCNWALGHIGQEQTITSLTENSKAARICNRYYTQARDTLLAEYPFPFARRSVALALTADPPQPGWQFQYAYPANCLKAYRVCTSDGIRVLMAKWQTWVDGTMLLNLPPGYAYPGLNYSLGRMPFEVVYGSAAPAIVTDLENAYLLYSAQVTDASRFTVLFCESLAWRLAALISMPMLASPQIAQMCSQQAQIAQSIAIAHGLNERVEDAPPMPSSVSSRG